MSIQVLSSDVINQIAAGEVVERPAHLVKELVENSLDAGATSLVIEVSEGGRSIKVVDNGKGILKEDLDKALQRHATSKISKTDDLWNLHTFGFRGEALASAAAVSKLTIKSIERSQKSPAQITSEFGKVSEVNTSSQSVGTEVKISDLFENVPARLKFLKTETGELGQIKNVVKALALAHHKAEFKLISNGQLQFFYPSRLSRIERVQDVIEKRGLFEVSDSNSGFNCHVVFSSPHEVAKTSKQIWIFAQNRWIQDRALQVAILDAYRSLLMHGEYPFVVLWLDCPPEQIDVNIHPTKSQVKYQDPSTAFKVVQNTLRKALEKAPWNGRHQNTQLPSTEEDPSLQMEAWSSSGPEKPRVGSSSGVSKYDSSAVTLKFEDQSFNTTSFKTKEIQVKIDDYQKLKVENLGNWSSLQVIGQANLTYLVCQKQNSLVFVDQHAAHERVVYETLMKSWREKKFEIQNYLFPLAIDLSEAQVEVLLNNSRELLEMGFEIEQLGPQSVGIKSAPSLLRDAALPQAFERMATEIINNGGSFALEKRISDLFATMACHSVVRAGQSLSLVEMQELLKSMDQFPLSSFCPHGRPVSVEKSFAELERQFGRIN